MNAPQKILVISLAGIGDTIFATALIRELRAHFPKAVIDALVLWKGAEDVLRGNPFLNTVYQRDLLHAARMESFRYLLDLRRICYDVSINTFPQSRTEYRLTARVIGARIRLSHNYRNSVLMDRLLVTGQVPVDYTRHCVLNNLNLLRMLGVEPTSRVHGYELFLSPEEHAWASLFLEQRRLTRRPLLGVHVGSGGTKNLALRRWPVENYAAFIRRMQSDLPRVAILLFGGPEERAAHQFLLDSRPGADIYAVNAGNLREAAALAARCSGFLSVDTALMHIAAVMRVSHQVVIETPSWNPTVEPLGNPFTLVPNSTVHGRNLEYYRYDGKGIRGTDEELRRCMLSVTVEAVFDAVAAAFR